MGLQAGDIDDIGEASGVGDSAAGVGGSLSNYLVCITEETIEEEKDVVDIGIVAVETSTGDVLYSQFRYFVRQKL